MTTDTKPRGPHVPRAGSAFYRLIVAVLVVASFSVGLGVDRFSGHETNAASDFADQPQYTILEQTWDLIQQNYVAIDDVKSSDLFYAAASGMVEALGDTGHSTFFTPDEAAKFNSLEEGKFVGIGVQLDYSTGVPTIGAVYEGSPAEKAGIRVHDVITEIDGTSTEGLSQTDVQALLVGGEGDPVNLSLSRPSTGETLDVKVIRGEITIPIVNYAMLPNDVALIRIYQFSTGVTNDLKAAIRAVKRDGAKSIIVDLRDNPGGLVFEAIGVASQFIPEGKPIYLYQEKDSDPRAVNTVPNGLATDVPLVVLINHSSASAAEINASAIHDNDRAKLIGETTFGTGTVLTPFTLSDGSMINLGTALWLRGNGDAIWKVGMPPDIEVTLPADADQLQPDANSDPISMADLKASTDIQLQAAYNEITGTTTFDISK